MFNFILLPILDFFIYIAQLIQILILFRIQWMPLMLELWELHGGNPKPRRETIKRRSQAKPRRSQAKPRRSHAKARRKEIKRTSQAKPQRKASSQARNLRRGTRANAPPPSALFLSHLPTSSIRFMENTFCYFKDLDFTLMNSFFYFLFFKSELYCVKQNIIIYRLYKKNFLREPKSHF